MLRSLNSGVTGLMNHQVRMDVIGNNISNVNTVGFKGRRVTFEESFNQLIKGASRTESKAGGTNPMQVGLGVSVGSIDVLTGQGNLQNTGRIFDLAIEGNAFFGVSDGNGTYYTRNGAFQLDSEGYIILPTNGYVLQGRMADSFGNFPPGTAIGNLQIPLSQQAPAKETTEVIIARNLDSEADAKGSVTYSQRMLHPADEARQPSTNTINDPGKESTTLNSLYNSKGQSLSIKENDALTISWSDQASVTSGMPSFGSLTVKVSEQDGERDINGLRTTVWTINDFAEAITEAINHDRNGNRLTYTALDTEPLLADGVTPNPTYNQYITKDVNHKVTLVQDPISGAYTGELQIIYDPGMLAATNDPLSRADATQIFNLQITSTNPLSNSYVNKAFSFGSHIGPEIGNYPQNTDPNRVKSDALLRPAEQFDYMYMLRDANGNRLYPGLDAGDPIDVYGSIGKSSIEDGKSDPLNFYPPNAYDISGTVKTPVSITDAVSLKEINDYEQWVQDVNKWVSSSKNNQIWKTPPTPTYPPTLGTQQSIGTPPGSNNYGVSTTASFADKEAAYLAYLNNPEAPTPVPNPPIEAPVPSLLNSHLYGATPALVSYAGVTGLNYDIDPQTGRIIQVTMNALDPISQREADEYKKWAAAVNKWAATQPGYTAATPFATKAADYNGASPPAPADALPTPSIYPAGAGISVGYTFNTLTGTIETITSGATTFFAGELKNVTLMDDLLAKIRNDFKLPAEYVDRDGNHLLSVGMNPSGTDDGIPPGSIVIRGSKGKDFSINNLSIRGVNSNSDKVAPTFFNAAMGFTEKRKAEDVGVFPAVMSVFDESGAEHVLTINFVHTGRAGEWEWKASFAGKEDILPGSGSGKVTFGQDGTVSSWIFDNGGSQLQVDPHNGSNIMYLNLSVGGPGDFRGITQFAGPSTINIVGQDGYTTGNLIEVTIDEYGLIEGTFSNGTNRSIAQIMMIDFANPGGLLDLSDSIYSTSANSGDPVWGLPITQSSSKVKPGAVEMSNVDLSAEFTNMITTQRGYQANSRVITVSDTMLEELVNLKR
ncbi:MAG: flagellar hook-basal body complex protein [Fibromonadaceae bacterium]|nr:flagellar hook-basal body complex protein [Fibromonadaceae bacterium]